MDCGKVAWLSCSIKDSLKLLEHDCLVRWVKMVMYIFLRPCSADGHSHVVRRTTAFNQDFGLTIQL